MTGDRDFGWPCATRRDVLVTAASVMLASQVQATSLPPPLPTGSQGFDFLLGRWKAKHRRLKKPLATHAEWQRFSGTLHVQAILHGLGNVDESLIDGAPAQFLPSSLRIFDRKSGQWSLYSVDPTASGIDKPLVGRLSGPAGVFYKDDVFDGRAIRVRTSWRSLAETRAIWERAFSADAGRTWETNWTMKLSKVEHSR